MTDGNHDTKSSKRDGDICTKLHGSNIDKTTNDGDVCTKLHESNIDKTTNDGDVCTKLHESNIDKTTIGHCSKLLMIEQIGRFKQIKKAKRHIKF